MDPETEWTNIRSERYSPLAVAGMGALRVSLLFGSAAVALALLLAPWAEDRARSRIAYGGASNGLDLLSTGAVRTGDGYTIRRSVLQPYPRSICIIRDNGARSGDC